MSLFNLLLAVLIGVSQAAPPDPVTMTGAGSQLNLELLEWNTAEKVFLTFSFETRTYSGRLATISALRESGDANKFIDLVVEVKRRNLVISLEEAGSKLSSLIINADVTSDKSKHQLLVTVDISKGSLEAQLLSATVGDSTKTITTSSTYEIRGILPDQLLLLPVFGASPDETNGSAIGCISGISLRLGEQAADLGVQSSKDILDECQDACQTDLNLCSLLGTCRNFFVEAKCECAGTDMQGQTCQQEASVVSLDGNSSITVTLGQDDKSRHPFRIALSFKANAFSNEQVLLVAKVQSEKEAYNGQFKVILTNKQLTVMFENLAETTLSVPNPQTWNELLMTFDYVGGVLNVWLAEEFQSLKYQLYFLDFDNSIRFGGCSTSENCTGLSGCLKEVYVDYSSVLYSLKSNEEHVYSNKAPLYTCDDTLFNSEVVGDQDIEVDSREDDDPVINESTASENLDVLEIMEAKTADDEVNADIEEESPPECYDHSCLNKGRCIIEKHGYPVCICPREYGGSKCQIPIMSATCMELNEIGYKTSDVYQIDVDREGPIAPKHVLCDMGPSEGITVVGHNIPNATALRDRQNYGNSIFKVNYKLMSEDALRGLKSNSANCTQYIQYDCLRSPIRLNEMTWFSSVNKKRISQLGAIENECSCAQSSCSGGGKCNCDSNSGVTLQDNGWLTGDNAGINSITVLQQPDQGWGRITLGELKCSGTDEKNEPVMFKDRPSILSTTAWKGGSIVLWFKTSDTSRALLLRQRSKNGDLFQVWIQDGHVVEFEFHLKSSSSAATGDPITEILTSQSPINDDRWHRLVVHRYDNEVRLSIDAQNTFYILHKDDIMDSNCFDMDLELGGSTDGFGIGFIGCMKRVSVDNVDVDLEALADKSPSNVVVGCSDQCASSPCMNLARCLEDYTRDSYVCECINKWAHSGPNCQHNANEDSAVSFHEPFSSYIKYQNLNSNPVNQPIVFSFRTDQSSSLMMYAHDQFYNFVQVNLWDDRKVSLTTNYNDSVHRCTVQLEKGDYSNMEWVQVAINYTEHYTQLVINDNACTIKGSRTLSQQYVEQFTEGLEYVDVNPPRFPVQPSLIESYTLLYVGGIPVPQESSRRVFYISQIPSLLGCLRGFKVGYETVDLRYSGQRKTGGSVRAGCTTGCESIFCQNGGHCQVDWIHGTPPICDCSTTSFTGASCDRDVGLNFEGSGGLEFDLQNVFTKYPSSKRPSDTFSFAFSTSNSEPSSRILAILKMRLASSLEVFIRPEQQIEVQFRLRSSPASHIFFGNFTEGKRHFIFVKFMEGKLSVTLDGVEKFFYTGDLFLDLLDVQNVIIGTKDPLEAVETPYQNYRGCISNVLLNFHDPAYQFTPLLYFLDDRNELTKSIRVLPEEAIFYAGQCAQYAAMGTPSPPVQGTFPPWAETIIQRPYVPEDSSQTKDKSNSVGIAIAILVIIVILVLGVASYIYYIKCIKGSKPVTNTTGGGYAPGSPLESPPAKGVRSIDEIGSTPEEHMNLNEEVPPNDPNSNSPFGSPKYQSPGRFGMNFVPNNPEMPPASLGLDDNSPSSPVPPPIPVTKPPRDSPSSDGSQSYYTSRGYDDLAFPISDDDIYNSNPILYRDDKQSIGPLPSSPIFRTPSNRKPVFVPVPQI